MGCWGLSLKFSRRKKRNKARGPSHQRDKELASTSGAGNQKARVHSFNGQHNGLHSNHPSIAFSDDDPFFDALSRVSGNSPRGGSPRGDSPGEGSTPFAAVKVGDTSDGLDLDQDSTGFPSPIAYILDHTLPALRRSITRSRRTQAEDDLENAGYVTSGEGEPDDPIIEPEGSGAVPGCLPLLNYPLPPNPKRYVRTERPYAGSSLRRRSSEPSAKQTGSVDGIEEYEEADSTTFMVRGKNYMKTKVKEGSAHAIYRLIGCDIYSFDFKLNHIAKHVQLPEAPRLGPAAAALPPQESLPPFLIINVQLPTYPASFFGTQDGPGQSLVYYFALPEGWEPSDVGNPAALGLLQRFAHNGREHDGTPTRDRLKLIPRVANPEQWAKEAPLSSAETALLTNYNDKPLLTRPQHKFFHGPNYLEIDVDVHSYAYLARKAFGGFIPRLTTVVFENAFVIQGNRPEELPEVVLAAARVARVNFNKVRPFPARMERTQSNNIRLAPVNGSSREPTTDLSAVEEDVYCIANTRGHSQKFSPPGNALPAEEGMEAATSASPGDQTSVTKDKDKKSAVTGTDARVLGSQVGDHGGPDKSTMVGADGVAGRETDGEVATVKARVNQWEHNLHDKQDTVGALEVKRKASDRPNSSLEPGKVAIKQDPG
eukprot:jgi/Botrbrau1/11643/Bobra.168_2s0001.1